MDELEYKTLLENCYSELPKDLEKNLRFVVPTFSGKILKSKTLITNLLGVSKDLNRDKDIIIKYLNKELGVKAELDPKNQLTLYSKFSSSILNLTLKKFFDEKVKCENCLSPDTSLVKNTIKCNACGFVRKS